MRSASEDRLPALRQVLEEKLVKRKVSLKASTTARSRRPPAATVRQVVTLVAGISSDKATRAQQVHQGPRPQGHPVPDPGRAAPGHRQEARRPAGRDRRPARSATSASPCSSATSATESGRTGLGSGARRRRRAESDEPAAPVERREAPCADADHAGCGGVPADDDGDLEGAAQRRRRGRRGRTGGTASLARPRRTPATSSSVPTAAARGRSIRVPEERMRRHGGRRRRRPQRPATPQRVVPHRAEHRAAHDAPIRRDQGGLDRPDARRPARRGAAAWRVAWRRPRGARHGGPPPSSHRRGHTRWRVHTVGRRARGTGSNDVARRAGADRARGRRGRHAARARGRRRPMATHVAARSSARCGERRLGRRPSSSASERRRSASSEHDGADDGRSCRQTMQAPPRRPSMPRSGAPVGELERSFRRFFDLRRIPVDDRSGLGCADRGPCRGAAVDQAIAHEWIHARSSPSGCTRARRGGTARVVAEHADGRDPSLGPPCAPLEPPAIPRSSSTVRRGAW